MTLGPSYEIHTRYGAMHLGRNVCVCVHACTRARVRQKNEKKMSCRGAYACACTRTRDELHVLRAALSLAEYRRDELRSDEGERDEDERIDAKRETKFAMSAWSSFERGSGWTVPSTPDRAELSSCAHGGAKKGVSEVQARCARWHVGGARRREGARDPCVGRVG